MQGFPVFLLLLSLTAVYAYDGFSDLQVRTINGIGPETDLETAPYKKIGQKFYHIESSTKLNWYNAAHYCRQLKGHLAFIENEAEWRALSDYLKAKGYDKDHWFWISGNDLGKEGSFYSIATGFPLPFTSWSAGQPDNNGGNENCVHLWLQDGRFDMNDWICKQNAFYICQLNNPRTIALTVF